MFHPRILAMYLGGFALMSLVALVPLGIITMISLGGVGYEAFRAMWIVSSSLAALATLTGIYALIQEGNPAEVSE